MSKMSFTDLVVFVQDVKKFGGEEKLIRAVRELEDDMLILENASGFDEEVEVNILVNHLLKKCPGLACEIIK